MVKKNTSNPIAGMWLAVGRILMGLTFLWAFFDKLFGLGFATTAEKAWLSGGSPTTGFLSHVQGPFADFFNALAGSPITDTLFMAGLLGIGVALTCGVALRLGTIAGSLLLFLMWLASLPLANNPLIDEHLIYIALLMTVFFSLPTQYLSLHTWWTSLPTVKKHPWLW